MIKVTKETNIKAAEYGLEVVEVRIKRTDLPPEIASSIFMYAHYTSTDSPSVMLLLSDQTSDQE